ncbi:protein translocase subunit SecF [Candidatus Falkowbacteria bacterium]|nr:protein translocase subunit SecF [Candidatus Falkowbacteria bacterium]
MLKIIQNRKIYFIISGILVIASILSLLIWGLKPAIDFTGGTLMEVEFTKERPTITQIKESLTDLEIGDIKVQPTGERGIILRMKDIAEETHQQILVKLEELVPKSESEDTEINETTTPATPTSPTPPTLTEHKFTAIGPVVGQELKKKTTTAMILVVICIIIYIAIVFRKVSKPVASWKYGLTAIVALVHDVLIIAGIFAALGHFFGYEVDVLFVTALLTVLGYSVNDTIVVFDRVRENLFRYQGFDFEDTVNRSVNESVTRSLNTSITTLLVLFSIYLFGGASIKQFILALICGAIIGTYSSIFLASPLLVVWEKAKRK